MLHGDISNRQSPILAFNLDNLLFLNEPKKDGVLNKIVNTFSSERAKFFNRKVDKLFLATLMELWRKTDFSIYLLTFREDYVQSYYEVLSQNDVMFTSLIPIADLDTLRLLCKNRFTYYFDNDEHILSVISNNNACLFSEVREKVGRLNG